MAYFILDLDDTLINTTKDMGGDTRKAKDVTFVKGACRFLKHYGPQSTILSAGVESLQEVKINTLYLRKLVRCVIIVESPEQKFQWLSAHVAKKKIEGGKVVVVGDRLDHEIQMGNQLDCVTVRMRIPHAKYFYNEPQVSLQYPNYTVDNFDQLMDLATNI